jgi:hypothetical protein
MNIAHISFRMGILGNGPLAVYHASITFQKALAMRLGAPAQGAFTIYSGAALPQMLGSWSSIHIRWMVCFKLPDTR